MDGELYLEHEKVEIAKKILAIDSISLINAVKIRLADLLADKKVEDKKKEHEKTEKLLALISGKWIDDKTADEMVADIYSNRKNKDMAEITKLFD